MHSKYELLKRFDEDKVPNYYLDNVFDIHSDNFEIYISNKDLLICITNSSKITFYDDKIELENVIITEEDRLDEAYKGNKTLFLKTNPECPEIPMKKMEKALNNAFGGSLYDAFYLNSKYINFNTKDFNNLEARIKEDKVRGGEELEITFKGVRIFSITDSVAKSFEAMESEFFLFITNDDVEIGIHKKEEV